MKSFLKNFIILLILDLIIFYFLQSIFINSLVFEKISLTVIILLVTVFFVRKLNYKNFSIILIIYICTTQLFLNIDRSKSFYILYWVDKYEITQNSNNSNYLFPNLNIKERINQYDLNQRIQEHQIRGLIYKKSDQLELTKVGKLILKISEFSAKYFKLSGWVGDNSVK